MDIAGYINQLWNEAYYTMLFAGGPGEILAWVVVLLTLGCVAFTLYMLEQKAAVFSSFLGKRDENGMRRMWMFNIEPYRAVLAFTGAVAGSFLASVLAILLVGVVLFLLMCFVKFLFMGLIWIAYLLVIIALLGIGSRESEGIGFGVVALLIGCPIIAAEDWLKVTGDNLVAWGFDALKTLNVFGWVSDLLSGTWQLLLIVVLTPIVVFAIFALAVMAMVGLVSAIEWCVMRYYNVHHVCPRCGHSDFDYVVAGKPLPVALHPGLYGVFHHDLSSLTDRNIAGNESVPTMLLNGKGKLPRRCKGCGYNVMIDGDVTFGTDVHVGFVGGPGTGKSWLMYGLLYRLLSRMGARARQVDKTRDTDIDRMHDLMTRKASFQTVAEQYTHAVQVMINREQAPVPWHTYWWDVAGENFDRPLQPTEMDFYRHVSSIVMVVDPLLTKNGPSISPRYRAWLVRHGHRPMYSLDDTLGHLASIIERAGRSMSEVRVTIVFTKADAGYLGRDYAHVTERAMRDFLVKEMDLNNFVANLDIRCAAVKFAAVSVTDGDATDDDNLLDSILDEFDIK